jgi:predicted nucleotidyltransferase
METLPKDSAALGMNAKWFHEVLACSVDVDLGKGCVARVITPALFLATKLEAFKDRGKGDYLMSRDLANPFTAIP